RRQAEQRPGGAGHRDAPERQGLHRLDDREPRRGRRRARAMSVVLTLEQAALGFGSRTLWDGLDLEVRSGELIAVLGANGSGKSSLLKAILGQTRLRSGTATFLGTPVRRGDRRIGYIPQQRPADDGVPLRGR